MSVSDPLGPYLIRATALIARTELDLVARGYARGLVAAALDRARGTAEFHTRALSPSIRGQAFYETLAAELRKVPDWMERMNRALAEP